MARNCPSGATLTIAGPAVPVTVYRTSASSRGASPGRSAPATTRPGSGRLAKTTSGASGRARTGKGSPSAGDDLDAAVVVGTLPVRTDALGPIADSDGLGPPHPASRNA